MAILKIKNKGKWESLPAFKGEPGRDGYKQYTAGEGITIENDTISAEVTKQYVDDAIAGIEIPEGGGSEELVSHYYLTINSSSKDFYDNPYDSLSGRTEEMITLCNNVYTDMQSGITPLLHLRYDYRAPVGLTTRYQIVMELDGQGLSSIDASKPFVFKHITRVKNAFKDVIHSHELRISYNASSNQITSMSFSGNSVEYATKEYVDSQIKTSITTVLEADY